MWVELIAFDAEQADQGVAAYLADMPDRPSVVSLLLYSAEFLHAHDHDAGLDSRIPMECTSYGARPVGIRGPRQDWTRGQLMALVKRLQDHDIQVYFAVFDLHRYEHNGHRQSGRWNKDNPGLSPTDADGQRWDGMINPLRRLEDGSFYEDFLSTQLGEVLDDYGFNGLHGADGFSSGRLPLWRADFGDDMVDQFTTHTHTALPPALRSPCDHDPSQITARAKWIWSESRIAWITFHAERWRRFWQKLVAVAHDRGVVVVLNNAWTRDPFEALYRYGIDYSTLADTGVDGMVLETSASAIDLLERPEHDPIHGMLAGVLLIRAHLPAVPIASLIAVHDTYEKWDVIHHAPGTLERDTRTLTAMSSIPAGESRPQRCVDALLMCLADGLTAVDWHRLDDLRTSCSVAQPWRASGVTVLYSPAVLGAEFRRFPTSRAATTHAILTSVLRAGANITSIARPEDHDNIEGPVMLVHPDLYDPAVIGQLRAHRSDVVLVSRTAATGSGQHAVWRADLHRDGVLHDSVIALEPPLSVADTESADNSSWLVDLPMSRPDPDFFTRTAALLRSASDSGDNLGERTLDEHSVQVLTVSESEAAQRILFLNGDTHYRDASVRLTRRFTGARALSMFPATPLRMRDDLLTVRIPPKGAVEVELTE